MNDNSNTDLNNVLNNFSKILKEKNIDINNIMNTSSNNSNKEFNETNEKTFNNCQASNFNNDISQNIEDSNDFSFDIETILKIKEIISKLNKSQNSQRNKLLLSLKPYLENNKQEKLDNYIKIANLLSILEEMNIGISLLENKQGYDFILIITLFLLIF